jgi:hypothetical protein
LARWGICTTLRAPPDQVLAFVAHHLDLGADHIWLHFDDPDDPALTQAARLPRTTAIACDAAYWHVTCKRRPEAHQNRQSRNLQRVYAAKPLPWIAHIDHDEFLLPARPIAETLDDLAPDQPFLRIAPFEALHDPALPDDIFTAQHFRGALRGTEHAQNRDRIFGPQARFLPEGMLSHAAGKCIFRTSIPRLKPQIHGAFRDKQRVRGGAFHPDIALLHFHAQDREVWLKKLDFRLSHGGYRARPEMVTWLLTASDEDRCAFYDSVQATSADRLALLDRLGVLRTETLGLRDKVARLQRMITQ